MSVRAVIAFASVSILIAIACSTASANPIPAPRVHLDSWELRRPSPDESLFEGPILIDRFNIGENSRFFFNGTQYDTVNVVLIPGSVILLNGRPWMVDEADESSVTSYWEYGRRAHEEYLANTALPYVRELLATGLSRRDAGLRCNYEQWRLVRRLENAYKRARLSGQTAVEAAEHALALVRTFDEKQLIDYDHPVALSRGDLTFRWRSVPDERFDHRVPLNMRRGETHMLDYEEWLHRDVYLSSFRIDGGDVDHMLGFIRSSVSDTGWGGYFFMTGIDFSVSSGDSVAQAIDRQIERSLAFGGPAPGPLSDSEIRLVLESRQEP